MCWSVCRSVCLWSVWKVYCGKTADWIRMPFGMVSGVGWGMGVLKDGPHAPRRRWFCGVLAAIGFYWFQWHICWTEMYLTRAWKVDNISIRTIRHWNLCFIGFPEIQPSLRSMLGFAWNLQECYNHFTKKSLFAAHYRQRGDVMRCHGDDTVVVGCNAFLALFGLLW